MLLKSDIKEKTYTQHYLLVGVIYAFARLEWDAVWCCERIAPNSINALADRTAGGVANKLIALAATLPSSSAQIELCEAAVEFKDLAKTRNAILHAKPGTASDGAQRLFRDGQPWIASLHARHRRPMRR